MEKQTKEPQTKVPRTRGPRSLFAPKAPPNRSHSLTKLSKDVFDWATSRYRVSESDLVDYLVRTREWGPGSDIERFFSERTGASA